MFSVNLEFLSYMEGFGNKGRMYRKCFFFVGAFKKNVHRMTQNTFNGQCHDNIFDHVFIQHGINCSHAACLTEADA